MARVWRLVRGSEMKVGDLVYLKHKHYKEDDYIGLIVEMQHVGRSKLDGSWLYDILFTETNELITISDIYFDVWRIE